MKRYWITPLTMGAFVLTGATGLLMFFEITPGFVKPVHEWLSLSLVLGAALHVFDHWAGIRKHLEGRWGKGFVAGALVLLALAVVPWPVGGEHEHGHDPAEALLAGATVSQISVLAGIPSETVIQRMARAGAKNVVVDRSIGEIAAASDVPARKLLAAVRGGSHDDD